MSTATQIELDDETTARVNRLASARQVSPDRLVQQAVRQFVDREEKRDSLVDELHGIWVDYKRTGEHTDDASADAWLSRLEAGDDVDFPPWRA